MARLKFPRPPSWMVRNALRLMTYRGCFALLGYPVLCVLSEQKQEMSQILPYQLEPEYSSTDERSESEEEEEDDSIFSNANTSDRRLDTSWCLCEQCTIMPTEVESICCKEPAFLSKMVEGIVWIKMLTLLSSCFAFAAFLNEESCLTSQLILYCSVTTLYCH